MADGLKHDDVEVRRSSAQGLGYLAVRHRHDLKVALPALIGALKDKDAKVRMWSVDALTHARPGAQAAPALVAELLHGDPDIDVRQQSALFFAQRPRDAKQVIEALQKSLKDKDKLVRVRSAWAVLLVDPMDNVAMSILVDGLTDHSEIVSEVIYAFGKLGVSGLPVLRIALKDKDSYVRLAAIGAMGKVALALRPQKNTPFPRDATDDLIQLLKHEHKDTVYSAVYVLSVLGEPDAVPGVIECLKHPDPAVRFIAARSLSWFGKASKLAIPALTQSLEDQDEVVRRTAIKTLEELGR